MVLDTSRSASVEVHVGISYVSEENAEANLLAENPPGSTIRAVHEKAHSAWNDVLSQCRLKVVHTTNR